MRCKRGAVTLGALACVVFLVTLAACQQKHEVDVFRAIPLYDANCRSCHGASTGGSSKDIPPPLNMNGQAWHYADQQLTDIILNGVSTPGRAPMPAFKNKLTQDQVKAILTLIKTWWTDEQRAYQKQAPASPR